MNDNSRQIKTLFSEHNRTKIQKITLAVVWILICLFYFQGLANADWAITFSAGSGGTLQEGDHTQTKANGSANDPVTAVPDTGYTFSKWESYLISPATVGAYSTGVPYASFNNPWPVITPGAADDSVWTVEAIFVIETYSVTFNTGSNGTLSGTTSQTINHGSDCTTVTANPDANYHFTSWTINSGAGNATINNNAAALTITDVQGDVTVTPNFAIDTYTVTFNAGSGGTLSGVTNQITEHGSDCTIVTAVPKNNPDYTFDSWTINSGLGNATFSDLDTAALTITNVQGDITVTANFAIVTHTVTFIDGTHGIVGGISGAVIQTIDDEGNTTVVAVTTDLGPDYHFVNWTVTGNTTETFNPNLNTENMIIEEVQSDLTVTANYAIDTHTVTFNAGPGGAVSGTVSQTIDDEGNTTVVAVTTDLNPDYHFVSWTVTGNTTETFNPDLNTENMIIEKVQSDLTVTANYAIDTHTVTFNAGPGGTVSGTASQTINDMSNCTVVTAVQNTDPDYHFVNWTISSGASNATFSDQSTAALTITNVQGDITVTANFEIDTHTVKYLTGLGVGTLSGTVSQTIDDMSDASDVTAIPSIGYHFVNWTKDSGAGNAIFSDLNTAALAITNVQGDVQVTANFELTYYTITPSITTSSGGGSISPSIAQSVTYFHTTDFTFSLNGASCVYDVKVDGVSKGQLANYTFSNVLSDHTIKAIFKDYHTITPLAGAGGNISPSAVVTNICREQKTFTMTPDAGLCVSDALVNGSSVYTPPENDPFVYTFPVPDQNQTNQSLDVSFRGAYLFTGHIEPEEAREQSGQWSLSSTDTAQLISGWQLDGSTVYLPCDSIHFKIVFQGINGWNTPADQNLTINSDNFSASGVYTRKNYTLTLQKSGTGDGDVSAGSGSISGTGGGAGTGSYIYVYEDVVYLTATPAEGFLFDGWTGGVVDPNSNFTTIKMDSDKTITAIFSSQTHTLSLAKSGEGTISASAGNPSGTGGGIVPATYTYRKNDVVTLSAVPENGWTFEQWTGGVDSPASSITTVTIDNNKTITAFFKYTSDPYDDYDNDGYAELDCPASPCTYPGGDCNDYDATIYPGASEICGDAIDQDCDGNDLACIPGETDADNDGVTVGGGDCNDYDATIYPGATEICGDGIDQNCNLPVDDDACTGDDLDLDGDKFTTNEGDCNDSDASKYPGAPEICGNSTDEDCFLGDRTCGWVVDSCSVDIEDIPLDTKIQAAPANIMFLLDDSGSMDWEFITNESNGLFKGNNYVFDDPGDNVYSDIMSAVDRKNWLPQWSGYNKMYYDPKITYTPWPRWNVLSITDNDPATLADPSFNADPDKPRSNPIDASYVFDFEAEPYCILYEGGGQRIYVTRENDNNSTAADAVWLVHENAPAFIRMSNGYDDAEQQDNGYVNLSSSDLDMVCDGYQGGAIGIRFRNVVMPSDWDAATNPITEAYIEFTARSSDTSVTNITFKGEKNANAAQFSGSSYDITGRTSTAISVDWNNVPDWTSETTYQTPNLAGVVNEIVAQGWINENAMAFFVTDTGCRRAYSYNGSSEKAPLLILKTATSNDSAPEYFVDNKDEMFIGDGRWRESGSPNEYKQSCYYSDTTGDVATWLFNVSFSGDYNAYAWVNEYDSRAQAAPYVIYYNSGLQSSGDIPMDQRSQTAGGHGGEWFKLGTFNFDSGTTRNYQEIHRAHYYVWFDENSNGTWNQYDGDGANDSDDDGEIYLIELDKTTSAIIYSKFVDTNNNELIDYGELDIISPFNKVPDEIKPINKDNTMRTYAQERQNFANWYSFFRRRELTAKSAIGNVIEDMKNVNIGILTIHNRVNQKILAVDVAGTDKTDDLLEKLYGIDSGGGTPLRQGLEYIGEYYKTGNLAGVSYLSPYSAAPDGGECQQSFAIVMTDGYYNGNPPSVGNADKDVSAGQETGFDGAPYADDWSNTLADVAMHYYETDLSALSDKVPTNYNDGARHQHMVTYGISFGIFGTLPGTNLNCPKQCPWPDPSANNQHKIDDLMHAAVNGRGLFMSAENPEELSDTLSALQHDIEIRIGSGTSVAINSQQLNNNTLLFKGTYDASDWSGNIEAFNFYTYQDEENEINRAILAGEDPNPSIKEGILKPDAVWSTAAQLDAANWNTGRVIITYDSFQSIGARGLPFRYDQITTTQKFLLFYDFHELNQFETELEKKVNYLRGDDSNEQPNGELYRSRNSILGDIVHSTPLLVGNVLYVGANDGMLHAFDATDQSTGGKEIFAYVPDLAFDHLKNLSVANPNFEHKYYVDNAPYAKKMIDTGNTYLVCGMGKGGKGYFCLDITSVSQTSPNSEALAAAIPVWEYPNGVSGGGYIPFDVNAHLFAVGDMITGAPSGSTAEVTEVVQYSSDFAVMKVKDIVGAFQDSENIINQGGSTGKAIGSMRPYDADMGYSFSKAFIVKSNAAAPDDWVVIFSNGYQSDTGEAVLFVLRATTGELITKIRTGVGSPAICNGLSTPAIIDPEMDGKVDYVYAGDLLGNMWKFDLTSTNTANWKVAFNDGTNPQPLFTAEYNDGVNTPTVQPITIQPDIIVPCNGMNGYLVVFGTGRYLGAVDFSDISVQTVYAIWDWADAWKTNASDDVSGKYLGKLLAPVNETVGSETYYARKLSNTNNIDVSAKDVFLLRQSQIFYGSYLDGEYRVLSDNTINWFTPLVDTSSVGTHAGWYFDLPVESERIVRDLLVRDKVLIVISSVPSTSQCAAGGDSMMHEINVCSGSRLQTPQFDVNGDGKIDGNDMINIGSETKPVWVSATGKRFADTMIYTPAVLELAKNKDGVKKDMKYFSTSTGTIETVSEKAETIGIGYWKELDN